jgi:Ca2+/Na+ antiporter
VATISVIAGFLKLYPKYWHNRYRNRIFLSVFLFCIIWTFYFRDFFSGWILSFLLALLLIFIFVAYHAATKPVFPETSVIAHLANLVKEGRYTEIEKRFPRKPFYIRSIPGRIEWNLLSAKKLMAQEQQRLRDAYEIYSELLNLPLFEKEKNNIKLKQVLVLLLLGDTNKSKSIFERTKQKINQDKYYEVLYLQSVFEERTGEFEKARQSLLLAVGEHDNVKDIQLATIYNNLGRMEKMLGNPTNTFHYYRKSAELALHFKEKSLIHVTYPNIIDTYLLRSDNKNAASFLDEYSNLIDKDNIDDLFKFNNYKLEYARQTKNRALYLETLVQGRIEILPRISVQEQLVFEISELRIRWNSKCGWDEKLFWVRYSLPEYFKLKFPIRYLMLKEIFNILRDLARTNNLGPFTELFSQLLNLMELSKEDIDRYILELPDYCVDERCFWEKEKAFLRGIQRANEPQINLIDFYEGMFEHLRNIKDIQLQHGNFLSAIEADLNIADECMGATQKIQDKVVRNYLRENMQKYVDSASRDIEKFQHHPASNEYIVRIARYSLFLGDKESAKKYYDIFVNSKISIYHYASWIQKYYKELDSEFRRRDI